MATLQAIAQRRARVVERLGGARRALIIATGVECPEQPVTNRDAEIAAIQQLENVAELLEALLGSLAAKTAPAPSAPKATKAK